MRNQSQKNVQLWDFYAPFYGRIVGDSQVHRQMFVDTVAALELKTGDRLLDAGCGCGDLEKVIFAKSAKLKLKIEAVDVSSKMLKRARKRFADKNNPRFSQTDLDQPLPFPAKHFNNIVSVSVLFSLPRVSATLKEFQRLLKKGGFLVLVEPKPEADMSKVTRQNFSEMARLRRSLKFLAYINTILKMPLIATVLFINKIMKNWQQAGHYRYLSATDFQKMAHRIGFEILSIEDTLAGQDNLLVLKKIEN